MSALINYTCFNDVLRKGMIFMMSNILAGWKMIIQILYQIKYLPNKIIFLGTHLLYIVIMIVLSMITVQLQQLLLLYSVYHRVAKILTHPMKKKMSTIIQPQLNQIHVPLLSTLLKLHNPQLLILVVSQALSNDQHLFQLVIFQVIHQNIQLGLSHH